MSETPNDEVPKTAPEPEDGPALSRDEIAEIIAFHAGSHALLFEEAAQEILDRMQGK